MNEIAFSKKAMKSNLQPKFKGVVLRKIDLNVNDCRQSDQMSLWKLAQIVAQHIYCYNEYITFFPWKKGNPKF
jgi:hypothetical protein